MYLLSDTVPDGEDAAYAEVAMRVLDLLTLDARVLDSIGFFARNSLLNHPENRTASLTFEEFKKARDGDKGKFFVALADHLQVPGDRARFNNAFFRVNRTRNYIAHAKDMVAMTKASGPGIAITYYKSKEGRLTILGGESWVSLRLLKERRADLEWMLLHVAWGRQYLKQPVGVYAPAAGELTAPPPPRP